MKRETLKLGDIAHLRKDTINPKELEDTKYLGLEHINKESLSINSIGSSKGLDSNKFVFSSDDILFGKLRPYFRKVFKPKFDGICSTDIWVVRPRDNNTCKDFLFYLMADQKFVDFANQGATGTRMPRADWNHVVEYEVKKFTHEEQTQISKILRPLDDKIELNQKMNQTLEEVAKTLFKSWFIDFNPVRAKAEGRPSGLSKEISDFFPDSFEDSELGEIPKGWKAGSLNEIIVRSKEKIKDTNSSVLAAVSSGELVLSEEYFSKQVFSKDISKYIKVEQYDFAYNPSRINIGSIGMNEYDFIGAVSPVYIVFKPLTHWHLFVSQFIRLKSTNSKINQLSSGSVRQSLSFDDFASIPITIPTDVTNMKFNEIYESLRRKIIQNQEECEILTSLRDTLLPKLISGELKIPDAENFIEEANT